MSEYYDVPSRFEPDEERTLRNKRGLALCRHVIGEPKRRELEDKQMTESERIVAAARERAAVERRAKRYPTDPTAIKAAASQTLRAIRANQTTGDHHA